MIELAIRAVSKQEYARLAREIGAQMRARRKELGMTQEQLAKEIGVENGTVGSWEMGHYIPAPYLRLEVVKALGLKHDELFWLGLPGEETRKIMMASMTRGKYISYLRKARGVSLDELSLVTGVNKYTILGYEQDRCTGETKKGRAMTRLILKTLGVPESELPALDDAETELDVLSDRVARIERMADMKVGERMRFLRVSQKMSRRVLAEKAEVCSKTICNYEAMENCSERIRNGAQLSRIAVALGTTVEELLLENRKKVE